MPQRRAVLFQEACKGDFQIVSRDHADQTWIVQDSVDDGPVSWSSRPPALPAPLRCYVLRAMAARSTRRGRTPTRLRLSAGTSISAARRRWTCSSSIGSHAHRTAATPQRQSAWQSRGNRNQRTLRRRRGDGSAPLQPCAVSSALLEPTRSGPVPPEHRCPSACARPLCAGPSSWTTRSPRWSRP